jgi:hypothetical protein
MDEQVIPLWNTPLWKKLSFVVEWVYPPALFFSIIVAPVLVKIPFGLRVLTSIAAVTVGSVSSG